MPALALIRTVRVRWLPPIPIPLFLVWPFVPVCLGIAMLLERERPDEAKKLRAAVQVFRELRGLKIDIDAAHQKPVRVWFV